MGVGFNICCVVICIKEWKKCFNPIGNLISQVSHFLWLYADVQHPTSLIQQKKPDLLKEPCTVTWDVLWDDLGTMDLAHAKDESRQLPPSRLIIRSLLNDSRLFDTSLPNSRKEILHVVKCHPGTKQAVEIRNAIQQAYNMYGPGRASNAAQVLSLPPSLQTRLSRLHPPTTI